MVSIAKEGAPKNEDAIRVMDNVHLRKVGPWEQGLLDIATNGCEIILPTPALSGKF